MSGYLPPGCTQRECDEAQPGYWDEPATDEAPECNHDRWNFEMHGRCCPDCGEFILDWGD